MLAFIRRRRPIVEERGPGWFAPARPAPLDASTSRLARLLYARHNLISIFLDEDYGSMIEQVRVLGRQVVAVNEPEAVRHVLVGNHDNYERKSPQLRRALERLVGDGLFISDGETWRIRRPFVSDVTHRARMPAFGRSMEAAAQEVVERWTALPSGERFDMLSEMAELTAEIIATSVFGRNLGRQAAREVVDGFSRFQTDIDSVNLGYFLGADDGWPVGRSRRVRRSIERIHGVIDRVLAEHLAGNGDSGSLLAALTERSRRQGVQSGLDIEALRREAATIFMAGHEGSTATLTWAWYLLANAPWVEEALVRELRSVVGDRNPTLADVPKLAWCRAVIDETLRLYPSIPIMARQARGRDRIGDIEVQPAALILVVPWLLHRSRDLWDRPHHFRPERFMGAERPRPFSYLPFGAGPRLCPGMNFGLVETVLCLATLAQKFQVRLAPGTRVEPMCRLSLRPSGGLPVTVTPREGLRHAG
jgi:cytochrome P450